jgi:hypothetical protein
MGICICGCDLPVFGTAFAAAAAIVAVGATIDDGENGRGAKN